VVELLRVIADSTGCSRLNGRVSHDPTKGGKGIPSYTTAKVEFIVFASLGDSPTAQMQVEVELLPSAVQV
jgi:hypothetical protein